MPVWAGRHARLGGSTRPRIWALSYKLCLRGRIARLYLARRTKSTCPNDIPGCAAFSAHGTYLRPMNWGTVNNEVMKRPHVFTGSLQDSMGLYNK